ncbi:MAG: ATP-binding protein [Candidatus Omnitrophica bacterium]|nr:ATP-binding protein [Candidatus Omnitrophota bacterium]
MKNRYLISTINEICFPMHKMAFVSGPRQCGKTTLAKMMLKTRKKGNYNNWDDIEFRRVWTNQPSTIVPLEFNEVPIIIFDEIHKAKMWKRTLKGIYDVLDQPADIIVTGSARLNVYKKGSDSLLGRYYHFRLHPFSLAEIQKRSMIEPDDLINQIFSKSLKIKKSDFGCMESLLKYGGFPEPFLAQDERHARLWRRGRVEKVIREDLRDISRIPELSQIEMLTSLIPERVGSFLSRATLREILEVSFDTIRRWLDYLKELYYVFELKPYTNSIARTLKKEGKIYLWDYSEIEAEGARFENMVASHLLKFCHFWTDNGYDNFELFCLRNKDKEEIDFLICRNKKPWLPVEVKLNDVKPSVNWKKFINQIPCNYGIQIVRKPNYWKCHDYGKKKILVASAADIFSYLV